MNGMDEWQAQVNEKLKNLPERLNPLLKLEAIQAADEAACRLDGMFRDLFNYEDRTDLIVTIIRAASSTALGLPQPEAAVGNSLPSPSALSGDRK